MSYHLVSAGGVERWLNDLDSVEVKPKAMEYMKAHIEEFVDALTSEVNCTELAEQCAEHLDIVSADDQVTIAHDVFDWAVEAADGYERICHADDVDLADEYGIVDDYDDWYDDDEDDDDKGW